MAYRSPSPSPSSTSLDDLDITHLDNVYQALMATILDVRTSHTVPDQPTTAAEGEGKVDAGAVKNAKRRKMDKKRAKREEQKLAAEEVVDAVGAFFICPSVLPSPSVLVIPFPASCFLCSLPVVFG
jgi:hypothetical protein